MEDWQVMTEYGNQVDRANNPFSVPDTALEAGSAEEKSESATPDSSSPPVAVDPNVALLLQEMQQLRQDFDTKVKYDESKERLIESLHRELQTYREGLHFRVLRPVFTDLITLFDDIGKFTESALRGNDGTVDATLRTLILFQETVEEILRRNGAESFSVEEPTFQPNRQRILRVVPTDDPSLDKQIARRIRKGFLYENIVLRSETVEIYKYTPAR